MARRESTKRRAAGTEKRPVPSRLVLWCAAGALIAIGVALFVVGYLRQGMLGGVFYLVIVVMGLYLLALPWRNRRAQAKTDSSAKR